MRKSELEAKIRELRSANASLEMRNESLQLRVASASREKSRSKYDISVSYRGDGEYDWEASEPEVEMMYGWGGCLSQVETRREVFGTGTECTREAAAEAAYEACFLREVEAVDARLRKELLSMLDLKSGS